MSSISHQAIDQLFRNARSVQTFLPKPVSSETIQELYELTRWGPTGFNSQPARFLFLQTPEAKARLAPALSSGNRERTLAAPVNVVIAWDSHFHDHLPTQFPAYDAKGFFEKNESLIEPTARTNATLQAAYLILAARALGLDVGPMSGFTPEKVDAEFFPNTSWRSLLLANIGYGDHSDVKPRLPRLSASEAISIL
jgi:3-hydroxypropanoate dehydrogenase